MSNFCTSGRYNLGNPSHRWNSLFLGTDGISLTEEGLDRTLSGLGSPKPTYLNIGEIERVYISIRPDGLSGAGTIDDPYDGSTAERMENILRPRFIHNITTAHKGYHYYFSKGTFPIWGVGDCHPEYGATGSYGFCVQKGDSFFGAGKDVTIFSLEKNVEAGNLPVYGVPYHRPTWPYYTGYPASVHRTAFYLSHLSNYGTIMKDFTVLLNPDTIEITGRYIYDIDGIVGRVSGDCTFKNIKTIGPTSTLQDGSSAIFVLSIANSVQKILIDNCEALDLRCSGGVLAAGFANLGNQHDEYPNFPYAPGFEGDIMFNRGTFSQMTIRNCYVENNTGESVGNTAGMGGISYYDFNMSENTIINCTYGLFNDTTHMANNVHSNNIITSHYGIYHGGGWTGQHITTNFTNNILNIRPGTVGIQSAGEMYDTIISNNIFKRVDRIQGGINTNAFNIASETGNYVMTVAPLGVMYKIRKPNYLIRDNLFVTGLGFGISNTGFLLYTGDY